MRFTLRPREGSATFQKITTGRKWVGRVGQCEDGQWFAKIGSTFVYANSPRAAFDLAVAKHLGFDSVDALVSHNHRVSQHNRANRARHRAAFDEFRRGNYDALAALFSK